MLSEVQVRYYNGACLSLPTGTAVDSGVVCVCVCVCVCARVCVRVCDSVILCWWSIHMASPVVWIRQLLSIWRKS